jgi:hypothetical protein
MALTLAKLFALAFRTSCAAETLFVLCGFGYTSPSATFEFYIHGSLNHSSMARLWPVFLGVILLLISSVTMFQAWLSLTVQAQIAAVKVNLITRDVLDARLMEHLRKEQLRDEINQSLDARLHGYVSKEQLQQENFVMNRDISNKESSIRKTLKQSSEDTIAAKLAQHTNRMFTKEEVKQRLKRLHVRINDVQQQLATKITAEEAKVQFVTNEELSETLYQQYDAALQGAEANSQYVTNEEHAESLSQEHKAIIGGAKEALADIDKLIQEHHTKHTQLNEAISQILQEAHDKMNSQQNEANTSKVAICSRIRSHTGTSTFSNSILQSRCAKLPDNDVGGHVDALLDHMRRTYKCLDTRSR